MAKIIEAKAIISAQDNTGATFDKIAKKIDGLAKTAKTSKAIDEVSKSLSRAQEQMVAIDKLNLSRGGLAAARQRFNETKASVESAARAIAATAAPTREMEQNFKRTQLAVSAAAKAFDNQKNVAIAHKRVVQDMGININEAAAHQTRLRSALERTNKAIEQQEKITQRTSRMTDHGGLVGPSLATAAGYVSAHTIGRGIGKTIAAGARTQHEETALANVGRTPEELKAITAASRRAAKNVPTSTFSENLKVVNETTGAFGSVEHALENLEFMQKANSVVHSAAGGKVHDGPGEMGNKMARFFEMRGTAGDHHVFQNEAEQLVKAMVFTGGNFNPSEAVNFAQQAKGALQNYDMSFLGGVAPSLITEMGGDRAGTGANAWRNTMMGKVRDQKQTAEWIKLGLIDPKLVAGGKGGAPQSWRAGAVKDTDTALKNPLEWTEKTLIPALQKNGTNVDDPLDLSKALGTMFRNQNANQFAEQITQLRARTRLHKDRDLMGKVKPMDQMYDNNLKTDPTQSLTALTAALENIASAASSPAMATAAGYITSMAESLQSFAGVMKDHPNLAMSGGAVAAGGALAGAGLMSYKLATGFGLSTSAVSLNASAAALTAAAAELSGAALISKGGVPKGAIATATGAIAGIAGGVLVGGTAAVFALTQLKQNEEARNTYLDNPLIGAMDPDGAFAAGILGRPNDGSQWWNPGQANWSAANTAPGGEIGNWRKNLGRKTSPALGANNFNNGFRLTPADPNNPWGDAYGPKFTPDVPNAKQPFINNTVNSAVPTTITGDVKGEVTGKFEVTASSVLISLVENMKELKTTIVGRLNSNGAGSTGKSTPEAAAPSVGGIGSH